MIGGDGQDDREVDGSGWKGLCLSQSEAAVGVSHRSSVADQILAA